MTKFLVKRYLAPLMHYHLELACDLIRITKDHRRAQRLEVAAVIVFLAGLDKVLSIACEFLYISGKIDRGWLNPKKEDKLPGILSCGRGLTAKIKKLQELGALLTDPIPLVEDRNSFIHCQNLHAGYMIGANHKCTKITLRPLDMVVNFSGCPVTEISEQELSSVGNKVVEEIGTYINKNTNLQETMQKVSKYLEGLPVDPQPQLEQVTKYDDYSVVDALNKKYIGIQWDVLLEHIHKSSN